VSAHRQFGCQFCLAFGILLVIMLTNPTVGIAQSCDTLPGDDSPLSCRFRANVPRCEGMYRYRVVASAQVEILQPVEHEQGASMRPNSRKGVASPSCRG
jgi:hypothetical protein